MYPSLLSDRAKSKYKKIELDNLRVTDDCAVSSAVIGMAADARVWSVNEKISNAGKMGKRKVVQRFCCVDL